MRGKWRYVVCGVLVSSRSVEFLRLHTQCEIDRWVMTPAASHSWVKGGGWNDGDCEGGGSRIGVGDQFYPRWGCGKAVSVQRHEDAEAPVSAICSGR